MIRSRIVAIFQYKSDIVTSKEQEENISLNSDRRHYANLFVAFQARVGDLENFFTHENHFYPVSLSECARLRKCTEKSDFLKCLEELDS